MKLAQSSAGVFRLKIVSNQGWSKCCSENGQRAIRLAGARGQETSARRPVPGAVAWGGQHGAPAAEMLREDAHEDAHMDLGRRSRTFCPLTPARTPRLRVKDSVLGPSEC